MRLFLFVTLLSVVSAIANAAEKAPALREGDDVILQLSDDVAGQYMRSMNGKAPSLAVGFRVSLTAEVAQRLPDGRLRIETSQPLKKEGAPERLMTFSALVEPKSIETTATPQGTPIYATPADQVAGVKPNLTARESTQSIVPLANMKGVTIRT